MSPSAPSHHRSSSRKPVLRLWWILGLLILSIGLATALIPKESELLERLVEDGRHGRALSLVSDGKSAPIADDDASGLIDLLQSSVGRPEIRALALGRLESLARETENPADVRRIVIRRLDDLPPKVRPKLLESLATRALQTGDPELSTAIYENLADVQPLDLPQLQQMVQVCRYSSQPRLALQVISRYLDKHSIPFTGLPEEMKQTTIALHREVNQVSQAFDRLADEFHATLEPSERQDLIELLTTTATQSNRIRDCLPLLEKYIAGTGASDMEWRELLNEPDSPRPDDAEFRKYGALLAKHLEWNNRAAEAFDLHCKLVVLGDLNSLERCVTIYPWIGRQNDVTDLLQALSPFSGDTERYTLLLARLLGTRGDFEEAESIYRGELAKKEHRSDPELWDELGGVLDATNRFEEARDAWRTALTFNPERHDLRIRLARLHVTMGNHMGALLAYRKLPAESHDRKTREDYLMLANSMDAYPDAIAAIRLKLEAEPRSTQPGHYLDIADAWKSLGKSESVETTLREGLEKFPGSDPLTLRLADHLARLDRKPEAFETLAGGDSRDGRYVSRILSVGTETGQYDETLNFLNPDEPGISNWSPSERLDLAEMLESAGELVRALTWYRATEGGEIEAARLEAELAYQAGKVEAAWQYQKHYLAMMKEPDHEAWTFLGDLSREIGRISDADAAYARALELLKVELGKLPDAPAPATAQARP